jgi:hypothetical protein
VRWRERDQEGESGVREGGSGVSESESESLASGIGGKRREAERPKTGSTAPVRGSYGRTAGFRFLAYFSIFPVFSENRTGYSTGPRLNRPVRSGF